MELSLSKKTDSSLSHETVVEGLLLCAIAELRYDGKKAVEITDWMAKVRDSIQFMFPDYHFIICKYPLEFTDYKFEDAILEWCFVVKDRRFRVFVFSKGHIQDLKETADPLDFYCGGSGQMMRLRKDINVESQASLSEQVVYQLRFEERKFNKAAWIERIYNYFETQLPELDTNPQQYLFVGRYPEYAQIFEPIYNDMAQPRLQKEAKEKKVQLDTKKKAELEKEFEMWREKKAEKEKERVELEKEKEKRVELEKEEEKKAELEKEFEMWREKKAELEKEQKKEKRVELEKEEEKKAEFGEEKKTEFEKVFELWQEKKAEKEKEKKAELEKEKEKKAGLEKEFKMWLEKKAELEKKNAELEKEFEMMQQQMKITPLGD